MFLIREINPLYLKLLERIYCQSRHHQVRQRAHFIILASQGVKTKELMNIFQVSHKTIYNWLNRWESEGIIGLYNKSGRGCKRIFNAEQESTIREWAKQEPRQLKKVLQKVKEEWGIGVSTETIKRIIRKFSMSWHRMRRDVGGEPDPLIYKEKQAQLSELKRLDSEGKINLYYLDETFPRKNRAGFYEYLVGPFINKGVSSLPYFLKEDSDETGFCLIPSVPYAWQNKGEYLTIPSNRSPRLNVLGIMNRKNHLEAYVSFQSINSDVVVACIDTFFPEVDKPTFIVADQASIHTSNAVLDKIEEWKERGITIFELPSYSPELNLIEILWRFIKYEWIEIDAYSSWQTFVASIEKILRQFGKNYVINFV
ncbi:MAG: IS630 family transposase [Pelatocladus maniniholoensis HA4357-MV3]|jgi:transposase|uniref:IS630 family transposase n=1 Tax=Pelatocladus maniniholoensis HA4357-MV3 TaxID=1117104 RepID=A0A9E3H3L3_9NOST|nr:IS630 family transposase [Pelatocladus maniniholoensis HA4357-MV3]